MKKPIKRIVSNSEDLSTEESDRVESGRLELDEGMVYEGQMVNHVP